MTISAAKMLKIKNRELGNNEELKEYLADIRDVLYELYIDISFAAEILDANLRSMKGVKNTMKARLVSAVLRKSADACKMAAGQATATWVAFQTRYSEELATAPKKPVKKKFEIV